MEYLRRQCAMREYCCKDVKTKALRRFSAAGQTASEAEEQAQKAVQVLVDEGFVSERRYACAYVRDKSSLGGWGISKIRYMLLGKGLPREIVEQALSEADSSKSEEKLRKALKIKYDSIAGRCDQADCRQKLLRFALSRGHDYESSLNMINAIINS